MSDIRLKVTIINATNLRAMDANGKSDPYVTIHLASDKKHVLKTECLENQLNPVWNTEFDIVAKDEDDEVRVKMFDKDPLSDDRICDTIHISVREVLAAYPEPFLFDRDIIKTDKNDKDQVKESGHFKFTILAIRDAEETRDAEIEEPKEEEEKKSSSSSSSSKSSHKDKGKCVFSWGTYGSTYSTDFSGYTSGSFESLGPLTPSSETIHHHSAPVFKDEPIKPRRVHKVSGTLISLSGLLKADDDGTDAYVTLQLFGKSAIEKGKGKIIETEVVHDTQDPEYNFQFEFTEKVLKGDSIELKVFQKHKVLGDVCIGTCRIPIKDIKNDEEEEFKLRRPNKFDVKGDFTDFGKAKLVLHHDEDFAQPE